MDNIIDKLSRKPEQFKKFNPNPIQEPRPTWDIPQLPEPQFPEYEDWAGQIESGEREPMFQPTETPTGLPTEAGLPTETGFPDVLNQIMGTYGIQDPMEALELLISMSAGEQGLLDLIPEEEPAVEEGPVSFLSLASEEAQQKYEAGEITEDEWKLYVSYQKDLTSLEKVTGVKATPMAIMKTGKEEFGFTMKDEYIEALMGELDWDYDKALQFYMSYIVQHPDYPRQ